MVDDSYLGHFKDLEINVEHDPDAKTVSIIDSGIGMSKADLINNLGKLPRGHGPWIWRQPPDCTLRSLCSTGSLGYRRFTSEGPVPTYRSLWRAIPLETFGRGTGVTLDLKEDEGDHVKEENLKGTARMYSWFIHVSIHVKTNEKVDADVDEDEDDDEENSNELETENDEANDEEGKEINEANNIRVGAGRRAEGNLVANHGRYD